MKNFFQKFGKFLLWVAIVVGVFFAVNFVYGKVAQVILNKTLMSGIEIATAKEHKEEWKNTPSDIAGMTMWDKYQAGLGVTWGSDTDGDGLTDKEEIEKYGSDPLKISTAGDLYSDSYKVDNDMDVQTFYEYEGESKFPYNGCQEVILEAILPTDFNAVIERINGEDKLGKNQVYAEYRMYNFSGNCKMDLATILQKYGTELSDISIYISDGNDIDKCRFKKNDDKSVTLNCDFESSKIYNIYVTDKNFGGDISVVFATSFHTDGMQDDITGAGLVVDFPLATFIFRKPINVYYEDLGNEEKTNILKNKVFLMAKEYISEKDFYYDNEHFYAKSKYEIDALYSILKSVVPIFDFTNQEQFGLRHFIFIFFNYEERLAFDEFNLKKMEARKSTSGFSYIEDTLPFGNFKSQHGLNGNCAGISHLTAYLYNNGYYNEKGTLQDITWNIGYSENATLLDRGLIDYKYDKFVEDHENGGQIDMSTLTVGEKEFINMVGAAYNEGNRKANYIYNNLYGGDNVDVEYDYSLIESMQRYLENGKILDVYLRMVDGSGHAVNIYGYEKDPDNDNVIWFQVYDSNFPQNNVGKHGLSTYGINLRVEKMINSTGDGYTFTYDYFPIENQGYGATSNKSISENGFIIVMDENWNILND